MNNPAHIFFRLAAQDAIISHVTPSLRSVSVSVDESNRRWVIRFVFDGLPSESQIEVARQAATVACSHTPTDWGYEDEFLFIAMPNEIPRLTWPVYERCEAPLVERDKQFSN